MKLTVFFLFVACMEVSAASYAQTVTFSGQNRPIRTLFTAIEKQTGYTILYKKQLIDRAASITLNVKEMPLKEVLKQAFQNQPLQFSIENNTVFVTATSAKEVPVVADIRTVPGSIEKPVALNNIDVQGVIKDEDGSPIPGASIIVKGVGSGTMSDEQGRFQLGNVAAGTVLEISASGFKTVEHKVPASGTLTIVMEKQVKDMEELVVTGYQAIQKKKFTGAAVTLKGDDIKIDGVVDIGRMLEGRAAGVIVQNVSGTFGSAPKIRIRGATSITGENKPLWVVDGIVLEDVVNVSNEMLTSGDASTLLGSSIAGINMNDVESIDILKDASATALFGARAMNGVVVITTKKGRSGAPVVNYVGNFGLQLKPSYKNYDIMNSADQLSLYSRIEDEGYINYSDLVNANTSGIFGRLANLLQFPDANGNFAVENTTEARSAWLMKYANTNTDWFKLLFKNSLTQEHTVSIASGGEKSKTYFSAGFFNDPGWTIADNVKRFTANLNNTYDFNKKLSVNFGVKGSVRFQNSPGTESRESDPVRGLYSRKFDMNPFSYALNTSRVLPAYEPDGSYAFFTRNYAPFNMIYESRNNFMTTKVSDIALTGGLKYKILKSLSYEFIGNARYVKSGQEHQVYETSNQAEAYRANRTSVINSQNPFLYRDPDAPLASQKIVVLPYGGFYKRTENELTSYSIRNQFQYDNSWNDKAHQLTVLAGQELRHLDRNVFNNLGVGYQYENGGVPYNYYYFFKMLNERDSSYYGLHKFRERAVAFFTRASYTFREKYTADLTVREDGSNLLGLSAKTRWLPTWTVAGNWNLFREKFMQNQHVFSSLLYKASYGLTASTGSATNSTAILRAITTSRTSPADQQPSIKIEEIQNGDLTWEKNYTFSTGLYMGFFKDRLNVDVEWYKRHSFDLIGIIRTAGIGGQVEQAANYADMLSNGVDLTIASKPVRTKNFSYSNQLVFTYNQSKITNQKNTPAIWQLIGEGGGALEGYPVRGLFSLQNAGLNEVDGVAKFINEQGQVSSAVDLKSLTNKYLVYEGPIDPKISGGFNNTFKYKNISLTVFLTYQAGSKVRLTPAYSAAYTDNSALPKEFVGRWTQGGDDAKTMIPGVADLFTNYAYYGYANLPAYPYSNYNFSHDRVADGGFLRMKSISVAYQLNNELLSRIGVKGASISVTGNNLWLIYADKRLQGQDPEFYNTGGVAMPVNKQVTASLRLTL